MHHRTESGLSSRSRKFVLLLVLLAVVFGAPALAQKNRTAPASPPKYDLKTEAKFKGTVADLQLPPKGSEKEIAHLVLKNGADAVDVYLCPQAFLADMGFSFSKGDEIALTGSKVKQGEADLILAREVVKGNDTLVLRDEKGSPVWSWRRSPQQPHLRCAREFGNARLPTQPLLPALPLHTGRTAHPGRTNRETAPVA